MSLGAATSARINSFSPLRNQDPPSRPELYHLHNDGIVPNTNRFYLGRTYPPLPEMPPNFSFVEKLSEGRYRKWKILSPLVHFYHWIRGGRRASNYLEVQLLNGLEPSDRTAIQTGIDHLSAKGRCVLARLLAFGIIDHANAQNWLAHIATDKHRAFSTLQLKEIGLDNSLWLNQIHTDSEMLQSLVLCSKIANSWDEPQRTGAFIRANPNGPVLNFLEELANGPCQAGAARAIRALHYLVPEIVEAKTILRNVRITHLVAGTHSEDTLLYQDTMSALNILIKRGNIEAMALVINRAQENDYGSISLLKKLMQEQSLEAEVALETIAKSYDLKTAANAIAALADLNACGDLGNIDPTIFVQAIQGTDMALAETAASTLVTLASQHNPRAQHALLREINPRNIIAAARRPIPLNSPEASIATMAAMRTAIILAQGGNPVAKEHLREFIVEGNLTLAQIGLPG